MKQEIALIVCIGPNNIIGVGNKLPWHSSHDFYHFKKTTNGYPCIFGDKTFFNLPKYPLRNRLNIVTSLDYKNDEVICCSEFNCNKVPVKHVLTGSYIKSDSVLNAIKIASNYDKIFICGGASIYKYCIENDLINTMYITELELNEINDDLNINSVKFPIDLSKIDNTVWKKEKILYSTDELPKEKENIKTSFYKYIKK